MTKKHRFYLYSGTIILMFILAVLKGWCLNDIPMEVFYTMGTVATGYGVIKGVENVKGSNGGN